MYVGVGGPADRDGVGAAALAGGAAGWGGAHFDTGVPLLTGEALAAGVGADFVRGAAASSSPRNGRVRLLSSRGMWLRRRRAAAGSPPLEVVPPSLDTAETAGASATIFLGGEGQLQAFRRRKVARQHMRFEGRKGGEGLPVWAQRALPRQPELDTVCIDSVATIEMADAGEPCALDMFASGLQR